MDATLGRGSRERESLTRPPSEHSRSRRRYLSIALICRTYSREVTMKRALITIATVGILAPTTWVSGANAQYSSPPPPAYSPSPAYNPSQSYNPSPRYTRRAYRRSARQTYNAPTTYTPGSGPPPYSVSAQTYASQSQAPYGGYAAPGPEKRGGMCVTDVDAGRGYGFQGPCPQPQGQRAALNPQPLPPSGGGEARRSR